MNDEPGRFDGETMMRTIARRRPEMLSLSYRGREIRISADVRRAGPEMILLLHGLGCTKESFEQITEMPELADFTTCSFDFPGHGKSPGLSGESHSMQAYADIVNLVVRHFSPSRLYLVGHSMGGAVGLIATQGLSSLGRFVSIEGNLVPEDCGLVSRNTASMPREEFIRQGHTSFTRELVASREVDLVRWADWYSSCEPSAIHESSRSLVEWSDSGKLLELFRGLDSRAFIYGGRGDRFDHLLHLLTPSDVFTLPDAGHFPMVDDPLALYATLGDIMVKG